MNNEPVAWMLLGLEDRKPKLINLQVIEHLEGTWIPLYTHPSKDLTDDEMLLSIEQAFGKPYDQVIELCATLKNDLKISMLRTLTRAILRKAQRNERK